MSNKRNLAAIGGLGRRVSRTLARDPQGDRQMAILGASDVSVAGAITVDSKQRLTVRKATAVQTTTESGGETAAILDQLIINLRASGILEG